MIGVFGVEVFEAEIFAAGAGAGFDFVARAGTGAEGVSGS